MSHNRAYSYSVHSSKGKTSSKFSHAHYETTSQYIRYNQQTCTHKSGTSTPVSLSVDSPSISLLFYRSLSLQYFFLPLLSLLSLILLFPSLLLTSIAPSLFCLSTSTPLPPFCLAFCHLSLPLYSLPLVCQCRSPFNSLIHHSPFFILSLPMQEGRKIGVN